ncbi:DUF4244 domain-containing protein [Blastococcus sp. Marseille-P5729]|uniref:DUF4244 domain-containing protein n=1 Tax=Blastococcus sp. Marseille-P5729 TaxID=2086582 RepID=UPI000D0E75DA|nr:DUF4244 domain-containing protein [Blastococcus sp. Marseille-P5729]
MSDTSITARSRELLCRARHGLAALLLAIVDRLLGPVRARAGEAGMTTAEYAVGTIAAAGFAAILYQVVTGDSIISALGDLISRALSSI